MHKLCRNHQNYPIFLECRSKNNFQYLDYQDVDDNDYGYDYNGEF